MILVVSSTNRPDSYTKKVAEQYVQLLKPQYDDCSLLNLEDLPSELFQSEVYKHKEGVRNLIDKQLEPATKYVFVVPEYNGSYPGVLKMLIDTVEIRKCFNGKKAGIVGVSSGRAGNLRGIDHLMAVLNHMRMQIMPTQPKLSDIAAGFDADNKLKNDYLTRVEQHVKNIAAF